MRTSRADDLMFKIFSEPKYKGKHVIVLGSEIYTARTGKQAQKILEMVHKKYPSQSPSITYIPKADSLILKNTRLFLANYKNVSTTQIYTHVTNAQLRDVHKAFHSGNK